MQDLNLSSSSDRPTLWLLVGPSGAGKSTLLEAITAPKSPIRRIVTHTTRPPRCGEVNGHNYHFVSAEQFANTTMIESENIAGNDYGVTFSEFVVPGCDHLAAVVDCNGAARWAHYARDPRGVLAAVVGRVRIVGVLPTAGTWLQWFTASRGALPKAEFRARLSLAQRDYWWLRRHADVLVDPAAFSASCDARAAVEGESEDLVPALEFLRVFDRPRGAGAVHTSWERYISTQN